MKLLKPTFLATVCLFCVSVAWAAIYQTKDQNGNVVFTDEPGGGAERVELPPLPTYTAPKTAAPPASKDKQAAKEQETSLYKSLEIVSPKADETIRENAGNISVQAKLDPVLKRSSRHKFQFYLDGNAVGSASTASQANLLNVDRGTHSVDVAVIDASGKEFIRSNPVIFHLQRVSAANRPVQLPRN